MKADSNVHSEDAAAALALFDPAVREWFLERFEGPTVPQRQAWPEIRARRHTLIAAPTGSGKTLAAFLVAIDSLVARWRRGALPDAVQTIYVSPLKALSNDIQRNLTEPLREIEARLAAATGAAPGLRVAVRTGDTPASQRRAMLKRPPHLLVTTPESLYLLLTSEKSRELLRTVDTVIVDEIHALARDKRGAHLLLTLERLERARRGGDSAAVASAVGESAANALAEDRMADDRMADDRMAEDRAAEDRMADPRRADPAAAHESDGAQPASEEAPPPPLLRIGLSATQRPIERVADFLVGPGRDCRIVDAGHLRELDLSLETTDTPLAAVCSHEQWAEVYERLVSLIEAHRSTLIFVNTRRLAERVAHQLRERMGEDAVASHHGSLSRALRLDAEQRLKAGQLRAIVATASLELGIDIGYIDLVAQIGSPRSIATFLQRIGRSGHSIGARPKGRLFPLSLDELLECLALLRAVHQRRLDAIEIPELPLDILTQQVIAEVASEEAGEDELFELARQAWPYRNLRRDQFEGVLEMASEGLTKAAPRGAYLHRDRIHRKLRPRRGARLAAITSGGAIPENAEYRVLEMPERTVVGTVDEDFAIDSRAGDVFLLGNNSWRVRKVGNGEILVDDAHGAPPSVPFWFGEAPGRTVELSHEISEVRREVAARAAGRDTAAAEQWLAQQCWPGGPAAPASACQQAAAYVAAQLRAVGMVPTSEQILFERFFDESGGMQLVIHSPLGARINRAWGLALRKRFCRSFDFELQAAATDNGIVLSLSPQHSLPLEQLFQMIRSDNAQHLLEQALLAAPMFQVRWRWNVTRALAVLRRQSGKKVPPFLQRFRSDDLLAAAFPETVGCLENHHGDVVIPPHPLVQQTMHDCLHEAADLTRWLETLRAIEAGQIELVGRDTREPSPFCQELLNANPYAFLDDAALEERRTRAVAGRRSLSEFDDLARLDPDVIRQVTEEAWPLVRDEEELHEALLQMIAPREIHCVEWQTWMDRLCRAGRAARVLPGGDPAAKNGAKSGAKSGGQESGQDSGQDSGRDSGALPGDAAVRWVAAERWPVARAAFGDRRLEPPLQLPSELELEVSRSEAWVELVRGWMERCGPITAERLAGELELSPAAATASLEALEARGSVLRGSFLAVAPDATRSPGSASSPSPTAAPPSVSPSLPSSSTGQQQQQQHEQPQQPQPPQQQWCDRRLLSRIHRRTLEGLRRQIRPVDPADFISFLAQRHQVLESDRLGPGGVREAIGLLQGLELPANLWEAEILAPRLESYEEEWLDQLFLGGEVMWGRLRAANKKDAPGSINRVSSISLFFRESLPWLLAPESETAASDPEPPLHAYASQALEALRRRGALFYSELKSHAGLLPDHLDAALRDLIAAGRVSSDLFAAIRAMTHRRARNRSAEHAPSGRWSVFPGELPRAEPEQRIESWCRLLVRRYGVVFADLLAREPSAPAWRELAPTLRRLELRGELRGGRFIREVAGEQFAEEGAVEKLRAARDDPPAQWQILSACDPLNLTGVITTESRVASVHSQCLLLRRGRCVAARIRGQVEWLDESLIGGDDEREWMRRSLIQGRRLGEDELVDQHRRWRVPHTT